MFVCIFPLTVFQFAHSIDRESYEKITRQSRGLKVESKFVSHNKFEVSMAGAATYTDQW